MANNHFFFDLVWAPQDFTKMHQIGSIFARNWMLYKTLPSDFRLLLYFFQYFENNVEKMTNFLENFAFFNFNVQLWRHFLVKMGKPGYHSIALTMKNPMNFVPCRLINYSGHSGIKTELRCKKPKTGHKTENRANRAKRMPFPESACKTDLETAEKP